MVYWKSQSRTSRSGFGLCGMEISVLLLLTLPFSAAFPTTPTHRPDSVAPDDSVQEEAAPEHHVPALKIVPFISEENQQLQDALKHRMGFRLRPRRAPQRGCQLGTCQLHNLANTLYHISKTNGKDESKKANDPQGYGR